MQQTADTTLDIQRLIMMLDPTWLADADETTKIVLAFLGKKMLESNDDCIPEMSACSPDPSPPDPRGTSNPA